ncbi:hypothetical protein FHS89_003192 [Rubricella aquisinus]|uniref:DUF4177 domain-containing protein n=1 Tax=Rubricella aquisinus TaxID=2028108 RepID=A0A840X5P2_9RHOB|nr:hypothetical protein [Rubricella aquisinus]MBB5517145.1 hypothetical protein [Rubricella aquisinus]
MTSAEIEYKSVPAPTRPNKYKGIKDIDERMAMTLDEVLNAEAQKGWSYAGSQILGCERKRGLFRRSERVDTTFLIFSRPKPSRVMAPAETTPGLGSVHDI